MELSFVCCVSSFSILISRQYFLKHIILIFLRHIRFVLVYIKVYCSETGKTFSRNRKQIQTQLSRSSLTSCGVRTQIPRPFCPPGLRETSFLLGSMHPGLRPEFRPSDAARIVPKFEPSTSSMIGAVTGFGNANGDGAWVRLPSPATEVDAEDPILLGSVENGEAVMLGLW